MQVQQSNVHLKLCAHKNVIKNTASFVTKNQLLKVNNYLKQLQQDHTPYVLFQPSILNKLAKHDYEHGVLTYLKQVDQQLSQSNCLHKQEIWQYFLELVSLVYPKTSACYSLIPSELKNIQWEQCLHKADTNTQNVEQPKDLVQQIIHAFENNKETAKTTLPCLISLTLCNLIVRTLGQQNTTYLLNQYVHGVAPDAPRIKVAAWYSAFSSALSVHIQEQYWVDKQQLAKKKTKAKPNKQSKQNISNQTMVVNQGPDQIEDQIEDQNQIERVLLSDSQTMSLTDYCKIVASNVTDYLVRHDLFIHVRTINDQQATAWNKKNHTTGYFVWNGRDLVAMPHKLTLPMVIAPKPWHTGDGRGGYLLSQFTNISYHGILDNKSAIMHGHNLNVHNGYSVNKLQTHGFTINQFMYEFVVTYKQQLTDNGIVLVSDRWLKAQDSDITALETKYKQQFSSPDAIRANIYNDLGQNKQATMSNQRTLQMASLFLNKTVYWPAVQDFRGRFYRIGGLNPQLNDFNRCLLCFNSTKPLIKRRKQSKQSSQQFDLLLSHVLLNDPQLIKQWDQIFGQRTIHNDRFSELLLDALINKKLSLIQVSQLLLIRQGAYDQVGVYYDASASAYQIMGLINGDAQLCKCTNMLPMPHTRSKQDLYAYVVNQLQPALWQDAKFNKLHLTQGQKAYLQNNFNRSLIKTIVMPLIYGKTADGFSDNLNQFFKQGGYYPNYSTLIALAAIIIRHIKALSLFKKCMLLMDAIRKIPYVMTDLHFCNHTWTSHILYYKIEAERIRLYLPVPEFKDKDQDKNKHKGSDKGSDKPEQESPSPSPMPEQESFSLKRRFKAIGVSINKVQTDNWGRPVKSRAKAITAIVANYIHFLDATICDLVIKHLAKKNIGLATVHDCFLIRPEHYVHLNQAYRKAMLAATMVHQYNLLLWLESCIAYDSALRVRITALRKCVQQHIIDNQSCANIDNVWVDTVFTPDLIQLLNQAPVRSGVEQQHYDLVLHYINSVYGSTDELYDSVIGQFKNDNSTCSLFADA